MKKLMNRAGLLAAAFALVLAVAMAMNAAGQTAEVAQAQTVRGSDTDGNGLIEITTHAQLNAMRYDLNGDGVLEYDLNADGIPDVSPDKQNTYNDLISCPPTIEKCKGYELKSDISLASYRDSNEWMPIGPWQAVFDGNGFSITGLEGQHGLFSVIGVDKKVRNAANINDATVVRNVDVVGAKITFSADRGGGVLAVRNHATIIGSYVTGELTRTSASDHNLGGLVATNHGKIYASVANVDVKVTNIPDRTRVRVGGFAGVNHGDIHRSYAYGDVIDARPKGVRDAHTGAKEEGFDARGFAVNHSGNRGTITSSLSYGDKIVTNDYGESERPARFAYGSPNELTPDSCARADEWKFTCPTPTPTPTPTD